MYVPSSMSSGNLSLVLKRTKDICLEETNIPEPGNKEVQIRIMNVGICGSDVHFWQAGRIGDMFVTDPIKLGHECSGMIAKVGPGVKGLKVGERVALDPQGICKTCDKCTAGRYNLCPLVTCLATPPTNGALARYLVHDADFVFRLPSNMTYEEGALAEPLSVGIYACRRARVGPGDRVLVCGAGPIGIVVMLAAKAFGASSVCITDIDEARLEFARTHWPCQVLHVKPKDAARDCAQRVKMLLGDQSPDKTIECSGVQFSFDLGVYATKPGGMIALVGLGPSTLQLQVVEALSKELEIVGSWRYTNTWPTVLKMISEGTVDVKPLVTHRFELKDAVAAMEMAKSGKAIKVMVDCR